MACASLIRRDSGLVDIYPLRRAKPWLIRAGPDTRQPPLTAIQRLIMRRLTLLTAQPFRGTIAHRRVERVAYPTGCTGRCCCQKTSSQACRGTLRSSGRIQPSRARSRRKQVDPIYQDTRIDRVRKWLTAKGVKPMVGECARTDSKRNMPQPLRASLDIQRQPTCGATRGERERQRQGHRNVLQPLHRSVAARVSGRGLISVRCYTRCLYAAVPSRLLWRCLYKLVRLSRVRSSARPRLRRRAGTLRIQHNYKAFDGARAAGMGNHS